MLKTTSRVFLLTVCGLAVAGFSQSSANTASQEAKPVSNTQGTTEHAKGKDSETKDSADTTKVAGGVIKSNVGTAKKVFDAQNRTTEDKSKKSDVSSNTTEPAHQGDDAKDKTGGSNNTAGKAKLSVGNTGTKTGKTATGIETGSTQQLPVSSSTPHPKNVFQGAPPVTKNEHNFDARGQEHLIKGEYDEAAAIFSSQRELAKQNADKKAEVEALRGLARAREKQSVTEKSPQAIQQSLEAYKELSRIGERSDKATAQNSIGLLYLRQNEPASALKAFQSVDISNLPKQDQALNQFNVARALEQSSPQDATQAYTYYKGALKADPTLTAAADAAFGVLTKLPAQDLPAGAEAAELVSIELRAGQTLAALNHAHSALDKWANSTGNLQLLGVIVDCYAAIPVDSTNFENQEWPYLEHVADIAPLLKAPIFEVHVAYAGDFKAPRDRNEAAKLFPSWRADAAAPPLARLLVTIGLELAREEHYQGALARYASAWQLTSGDSTAAVLAASLMRDHHELINTDRELFDRLLEGLFQSKADYYRKYDWPNILRLHTVLGSIFAEEQHWGPDYDSHSAIFQWRNAIQAEAEAMKADKTLRPAPVLHLKLAEAYRSYGKPDLAVSEYFTASRGFIAYGNRKDAESALAQAQSLGIPLNGPQKHTLKDIQVAIQGLGVSISRADLPNNPSSTPQNDFQGEKWRQ